MGCVPSSPRRSRGSRHDSDYGVDLSGYDGGFQPGFRPASSRPSRSNTSSSRRPRHAVDMSSLDGGFEPRSRGGQSYRSRPEYDRFYNH